jgi:hypothetical protein
MKKITAFAAAVVLTAGFAAGAALPKLGVSADSNGSSDTSGIELPIVPIEDDSESSSVTDDSSSTSEIGGDDSSESEGGSSKPETLKGDLNGDNKININDLTKLAAHIKGKRLLPDPYIADFNNDGKINVSDLTKLAAHIKGKRLLS